MTGPLPDLAAFYVPWLGAVAASAAVPDAAEPLVYVFQGLELPVLNLVLAALGVLIGTPLAPRRSPPLALWKRVLATLAMLIAALAWTVDARPGVLFGFVVSIGLGFSGYALIELAGRETRTFVKRIFEAAGSALDNLTGRK